VTYKLHFSVFSRLFRILREQKPHATTHRNETKARKMSETISEASEDIPFGSDIPFADQFQRDLTCGKGKKFWTKQIVTTYNQHGS
jgi:hypothetical protein